MRANEVQPRSLRNECLTTVTLAAAGIYSMMQPLASLAELSNESMIGPGLRTRPAYDGSATQHADFVPVVRYFGQPWFVRSTQGVFEGGLRASLAPGLNIGAQIAYEAGRNGSKADFLRQHDVPDINAGASVGAHLEWDHTFGPMPVTVLARVRQHIESDRGAQADVRFSAGIFRQGPFSAGLFTQAVWANAKSANAYYGTSPVLLTRNGLPAFNPGSGWMNVSAGLLWSLDLNKTWIMVGSVEARRLQGDVANSPLIERKTSYYATVGIAYRF